ncbi:hypothetical protein BJV82DRAFT_608204 [Fennellomyces sp. T-0311]|nr:hypothetical protein BJV82DRAFT_608204 [Fennellomyces sp. T-0311]
MAERIFDVNDTVPTPTPIAYDLDPSPHIHSIRNVIVKRYAAKKRRLSTSKIDHRPLKKKHVQKQNELVANGGLPSPPVDSPRSEFPGDDHVDEEPTSKSVATTTKLTASDIVKKLDELKEEKHRLFQLIKRLMQQEQDEQQQQQQQVEAPPPPVVVDNKPNSSPWSVNENDMAASSTQLPPSPAPPTAPAYRPSAPMPPPHQPNDHFRRPPVYGRPFNNNNKRPYSSNSSRPLGTPPPHPQIHAPRYFHRQRPMYRPSYTPRDYAPQPWSSPVQP